MGWTKQQETAIIADDRGLIVSAAAGSGKTSVLVERLTRKIADRKNRVPVEKIIVVTFTKNAAAEIKHRLSASLDKAIAMTPDDDWLRRQQMLLASAKISTINAFCFDLIREHMSDSEITSGFKALDESEEILFTGKAADIVINRWHMERREDMEHLWNAFCRNNDSPLEEVLMGLHNFLGSVAFRDIWINKTMAEYAKPASENMYYRTLIDKCRSETAAVRKLCDRAVYLAGTISDNVKKKEEIIDYLMIDYDSVSMLLKLLNEKEPDIKSINDYAIGMYSRHNDKKLYFPKKEDQLDMMIFDKIRDVREQYRKRIDSLLGEITSMLPYFKNDMEEHMKLLPLLCELEADMTAELWKMKTERNSISFSDGESLALQLLAETDENGNIRPTSIAMELSQYYELIMIDEYQDSNDKLDYVFRLLSRNGYNEETGELTFGDNVFLVGDVKQCIYQFRNANPSNFRRAASSASPFALENGAPLQLLRLSMNFRSSGQTVAFVNFLFANIMSLKCGEVDYTEEEWLYTGADGYDKIPLEEQAVTVAVLPEKEDEGEQQEYSQSIIYTCETIKSMLAEGTSVRDKSGVYRPCRPEDFCILVRKKELARKYADALTDAHIPVMGVEEKGYLRSKEISLLLNLLRVIDNPLLETPLAAVMVSPMFSFTADDLAEVRLTDRSMSLYPAMCLMLEEKSCGQALYEKCRNLYETIADLRQSIALYSLDELIRRIYETTDFLSVMQLYQDGDRKRANLHLLLQYARTYEENSVETGGVTGFLRYIDTMLEKGRDFAQAENQGGSDNAVSVKTMHGSKGLEYPFVFVCGTETEFSNQDSAKKIMCADSGMAGFRLQNPDTLEKYQSLPHMVINDELKKRVRSEEMRLLYVSLTRAKQKLFIPMRYSKTEKKKLLSYAELMRDGEGIPRKLTENVNTMSDWIWMALMLRGDEEFVSIVPEGETNAVCCEEKYFSDLCISYLNSYEPSGEVDDSIKPMPAPDMTEVERLRSVMEYEYRTKEQNEVSLMSVSAAAKSDSGESLTLKRPRCIRESGKALTGAEHGTAVHAFFQYARFSRAERDSMKELVHLYERGYITEEQLRTVKRDEIEPFFTSSLYERIKKSSLVLREKKFLVRISDLEIPENIEDEALKPILASRGSGSMMKGIIDIAFREEDGFVLADYKTDNVRTEEELLKRYKLQLYIYSLALHQITGAEVKECLIYSTVLRRTIKAEFGNI